MEKGTIKKIFAILLGVSALCTLVSCKYDELPPKTKDASSNYILPTGELPSGDELQELKEIRQEYENSTKRIN